MKPRVFQYCLFLLVVGATSACSQSTTDLSGGDEDEQTHEGLLGGAETANGEFTKELADALKQVAALLDERADEGEPTHLEDLVNLLPTNVDGLAAVLADSRKSLIGLGVTNASATYAGEDIQITIDIVDLSTLAPLASVANRWLAQEIDRESDRGFERTTKFQPRSIEYQAFESYSGDNDHSECATMIWVADRIIVSVKASGSEVEMGDCTDARDEVSFRKLERLARALADG